MKRILRRSIPAKWLRSIGLFGLTWVAGMLLSHGLNTGLVAHSQSPVILAGGTTTVSNRSSSAYEQPSAGLSEAEINRHLKGDLAFEAVFVTAPSPVHPGLGPLFNNPSCAGCHLRNGRGLPEPGQIIARVSLPETEGVDAASGLDSPVTPLNSDYHPEATVDAERTPPVPGLGTQIQDQGTYGQPPEATVKLQWQSQPGQYADGTAYALRSPQPQIILRDSKPLPSEVQVSLRLPPPVFGLGLLEAVPESEILALADPEDANSDGISGRPNQVWDVIQQTTALGRFGLKANQPNLLQQSAAAYVNDMGVTNPLFPEINGDIDIDRETLENAEYYVQTLSVPARTLLNDPQVQRGEKLFADANCAACHVAELHTGNHKIPVLANQTIHPYTDLLLHDMGEGLADRRADFQATGSEWRTSPLWGIGLTQTVLPYSSYLHDGRARTLEEAILWHGGEAESAKEAFRKMPADDRAALIRFLRSL